MRAVLSVLLLVGVVQGQASNEAEKLFRAMEKTLTDAKTRHIAFEAKLTTSKGDKTIEMTVKAELISAGNKILFKGETTLAGMSQDLEIVCDGTEVKGQVFGKKFSGKDAPKDLNQLLVFGALCRIGIVPAFFSGAGKDLEKANAKDFYQVSDFKLADKVKINKRPAQGVQYQVKVTGLSTFKAEVIVDTDANVPLRRRLSTEKDGQKLSLVESYTVQLNPKINDKAFELR